MDDSLQPVTILCHHCHQDKPLTEFRSKSGNRYVRNCAPCREVTTRYNRTRNPPLSPQNRRLPQPTETYNTLPRPILPRGHDSQDTPETMAQRRNIIAIQRRHRTERRQGQEPSPTPPMPSYSNREAEEVSSSLHRVPSHRSLAPSSTPSRPSSPFFSRTPTSSQPDLQSLAGIDEPDPIPNTTDPNWLAAPALNELDQDRLRKFHEDVVKDRQETCVRCSERWYDLHIDNDGVCRRCNHVDRSRAPNEPFLFSDENHMDPRPISHNLPKLTVTEEMLIARVHVSMQIRQVRGAQYRYRGHTCNFMRNTARIYDRLPVLPRDLNIIILRPPSTAANPLLRRQYVRDFRVRRDVIHQWLQFLRQNHTGYAEIGIAHENLSQLPEDGTVADQVQNMDVPDDDLQSNTMSFADPADDAEEGDTSIVPDLQADQTDLEALRQQFTTNSHHLSMPSMRETPINEFALQHALLSLAFPVLFPYGKGDIVQPRPRTVAYDEYLYHLMRYKDGRFARHDRFRFVAYDTLMRRQISGKSSFFVSKLHSGDASLKVEEILAAFHDDSPWSTMILNSLARYSGSLRGTRPFWGAKRTELDTTVKNIGSPHIFVTLSAADYHWDSLMRQLPNYNDWQRATSDQRVRLARIAVVQNPMIVAHHFHTRFTAFRKCILHPKFNVIDFWYRYEWQSRGSVHCHGVYWCRGTPSPEITSDNLRAFASFWDIYITAWHPQPGPTPPPAANPLSLSPEEETNTFEQLSTIVNRVQLHVCSPDYCLRKKKSTGQQVCRFNFPIPERDTPTLERPIANSFLRFFARRNHAWLNNYCRAISLSWKANTDIAPCTGAKAVINYIGKYCTKSEDQSPTYQQMARQLLPHVAQRQPMQSFVMKIMNRFIGERDISAQEVCHILLKIPLQHASREVVSVDLRPETAQDDRYDFDEEGEVRRGKSRLEKYKARLPQVEEITYFNYLRLYDHSRQMARPRPRAPPRMLRYFPYYKPDTAYEDYCRAKLLLHVPFRQVDDVLRHDDRDFNSFVDAYEYWHEVYPDLEPDDFMADLPDDEDEDDDLELLANEIDYDPFPSTLEELARMRPNVGPVTEQDSDELGQRDIDKTYDWSRHIGTFSDLTPEYWIQAKQADPADLDVHSSARPEQLNPRQRLLYETVVKHYIQVVEARNPPQLLINLDGKAGTGKTFTIMLLSSRLQEIAESYDKPPPIIRAAPTGVAAHAIHGRTLHQLFRLPLHLRTTYAALGTGGRTALQNDLQHTRYIVIDEKSMLGLRTLAWIHHRCGEAFPHQRDQPFGGLNIILAGDFYQLPPIRTAALYKQEPDKEMEAEALHQYRQFDVTIELQTVQRQVGSDSTSVGFRQALDNLRGRCVTVDDWKLLCTRIRAQLPPADIALFYKAVRIYTTKVDVTEYNNERIRALGTPVLAITAQHSVPRPVLLPSAKKVGTSDGGNLHALLQLAIGGRVMLTQNIWVERGLVNGSMGTVRDITWREHDGIDPRKTLPLAVLVAFDGYDGPTLTTAGGANAVPIFPVTRDFYIGAALCHRTQLPLTMAYAITVHKSQGMTLDRVVLNITKPDFAPGLTYVAVSRCKTLQGILFEQPFDYDRFAPQANSKIDDARQIDRDRRAAQHLPVNNE